MMKNIATLIAILFLAQSCSKTDSNGVSKPSEHKFLLSTKLSQMPAQELTNINAYVFSDGILVKIFQDLLMTESTITIDLTTNTQVYFLAGLSTIPASLNSLQVNKTSKEAFLALTCDPLSEALLTSSTIFYTGYYDGAKSEAKPVYDIEMTRSVSRLDLDASSDPLIKITDITATGVPVSSVIFGSHAQVSTTTIEKRFETPVSGKLEGFMHLFESASPIGLTLNGTYNDIPIKVNVEISSVKRNTAYTVKVSNIGGSVTGSITTKEWEQGDVVDGKPDVNTTISIDKAQTTVTAGITIDDKTNHIVVSELGGELTIALSAQSTLQITSVDGANPLITVGEPSQPEAVGDKLITKIPIVISAQQKGRLPYQVRINIKSSLTQNAYDYLTIDVDGNIDQIPTVPFAGYEIMAFNTTGQGLDDQVYLTEGSSVEDMYNNRWEDCSGRMFQFGRLPGYYPYQSMPSKPMPTFMEWNQSNGAPCPDGFRMLTRTELHKIMPPNTAGIPLDGSVGIDYLIDGKVARMDLISPNKTVTMGGVRNITPRYIRLTCEGNMLIIPMAGYKWISSGIQNIGGSFFLMAANRDGGETRVYGYAVNIIQNEHNNVQPRHLDNHNFVRCVKK